MTTRWRIIGLCPRPVCNFFWLGHAKRNICPIYLEFCSSSTFHLLTLFLFFIFCATKERKCLLLLLKMWVLTIRKICRPRMVCYCWSRTFLDAREQAPINKNMCVYIDLWEGYFSAADAAGTLTHECLVPTHPEINGYGAHAVASA